MISNFLKAKRDICLLCNDESSLPLSLWLQHKIGLSWISCRISRKHIYRPCDLLPVSHENDFWPSWPSVKFVSGKLKIMQSYSFKLLNSSFILINISNHSKKFLFLSQIIINLLDIWPLIVQFVIVPRCTSHARTTVDVHIDLIAVHAQSGFCFSRSFAWSSCYSFTSFPTMSLTFCVAFHFKHEFK